MGKKVHSGTKIKLRNINQIQSFNLLEFNKLVFFTNVCHVEVSVSIALSVGVCVQVPALCEDLLSSVDQPLKIARDQMVGKDYLLCDYNRDGDSYRSSLSLHHLSNENIHFSLEHWPLPFFCSM